MIFSVCPESSFDYTVGYISFKLPYLAVEGVVFIVQALELLLVGIKLALGGSHVLFIIVCG